MSKTLKPSASTLGSRITSGQPDTTARAKVLVASV
jgi:hypothetical protein